jgi:hypothetical protein
MSQPIEQEPDTTPVPLELHAPRPRLRLVSQADPDAQVAFNQIWHGDADIMSPAYTTLSDWPTERDFAPFVKAAFASGDARLVEQLRKDREYCAAMRRKLRREASKHGAKA